MCDALCAKTIKIKKSWRENLNVLKCKMCFNVHRISYKAYTNWECGSLEDLTFHLSYGLILLQILKTKGN